MINLPEEFLERMRGELVGEYEAFIKSYDRPAEKGVRVNALKIAPEEFLKLAPVATDGAVEWERCGFYANGEGIGKTVFHAAGLYYVQEPSAMSAVPKLEVKAGERVLDLCAAPGGKTTQIAAYMGGNRKIIKNFAYPDEFIPQGGVAELMKERGVSAEQIVNYIKDNENR